MGLFAALADTSAEEVCGRYGGGQFSTFKGDLADLAVDRLGPISDEMRRLMEAPDYVDQVLGDGARRAHDLAQPTLNEIQDIIGFLRP